MRFSPSQDKRDSLLCMCRYATTEITLVTLWSLSPHRTGQDPGGSQSESSMLDLHNNTRS